PTPAKTRPAAGSADGHTVTPFGPPQGCPPGDFCVYRDGGGGHLLMASGGNEPSLGGADNQDGAVFNNGYADPYDVVEMYWGYNYTYAYTCIARGNYWLYTSHYYFNHGYAPDGNYNLQNNVASERWVDTDCGNSGG